MATAGPYRNSGNVAANALDGNRSTFFDSPTAGGVYVGLDLGSVKKVSQISFAPRPGSASRMVGGIFRGSKSSTFSSATTLYAVTTPPTDGVPTTVPTGNGTAFRYVRYLGPEGSYGDAAETDFIGPTPATGGALAVHLFSDTNENDVQDAGEKPIVGCGGLSRSQWRRHNRRRRTTGNL